MLRGLPIALPRRPVLTGPRSRCRRRAPCQLLRLHEEVALWDLETESIVGTMTIADKYAIDKDYECTQVFRTIDPAHPGVQKVME